MLPSRSLYLFFGEVGTYFSAVTGEAEQKISDFKPNTKTTNDLFDIINMEINGSEKFLFQLLKFDVFSNRFL